jgi:hypothetical protein
MAMMADYGIRNVFLPPTALKLMRQAGVKHQGVRLRSIFTGGESLGGELLDWVRATFGIDAHEVFGQTECNRDRQQLETVSDPARFDGQGDARLRRPHRQRQGRGIAAGTARHHRRAPARSPAPCSNTGEPGSDREEICRRFLRPAISACRMRTAISGMSAARTT